MSESGLETQETAAQAGAEPAAGKRDPARSRVLLRTAAIAASPLVAALLLFAGSRALSSGQVLRGVSVAGVPLAGLDRPEVERAVRELDERLRVKPAPVRVADKVVDLDPGRVGFHVDVAATTDAALGAGRTGGFIAQLGFWFARWYSPFDVPPVTILDPPALEAVLAGWDKEAIGEPPFEGAVLVRDRAPVAEYPRAGRRIERDKVPGILLESLGRERREVVVLPLSEVPARLDRALVDAAVSRARVLLAAPVVLTPVLPEDASAGTDRPEDLSLRWSPDDLGRALRSRVREDGSGGRLSIELYFDPAVIDEKLGAVRPRLEAKPEDARFTVDARDRVSILPSRPGRRIDAAHVAEVLLAAAGTEGSDGAPGRAGVLPVDFGDPPEFSTEAAAGLHIEHLVSTATTRHPCCQARVKNIHRIADMVNGRVVRPGETLSLNALVGERTQANGFVMAPGIEDGEMVDTMGGGVSQFATTYFNAMFHGGYDIIERQPHSFWFSRYPEGHEATLSWPKPDLIIRNDTDAGILIKTEYSKTSITVKLYGNNGGRKVAAKVSRRQDIVEPPIEYIPNPKLSPHRTKVKESGMVGWSIIVARILTFPDGTTKEERRKVTYKPRVRRVQVHPCRIPKGFDGYTGDPCPEEEETEESESDSSDSATQGAPAAAGEAAPF